MAAATAVHVQLFRSGRKRWSATQNKSGNKGQQSAVRLPRRRSPAAVCSAVDQQEEEEEAVDAERAEQLGGACVCEDRGGRRTGCRQIGSQRRHTRSIRRRDIRSTAPTAPASSYNNRQPGT